MATLTSLTNLQRLQPRLPAWHRNYWGWLQPLLRLTSIHINYYGMLAWRMSCVRDVCFNSNTGKRLLPKQ